ncbi:MAG: acyltransferase, partial [Actinobacteria bacterium]|nr:acyltransferase [Actinomycetota bacterium]
MLVPDEAVDTAAPIPVPAAAPAPPAPEFLAGDGIRGVGMICIIVAHLAGGTLLIDGVFTRGFRAGYGAMAGVVLSGLQLALPVFFVLSAYLISRPYIHAYVLNRRTPSLRRYLRHRVLRIIPVFWLLGAVMFAVYGTGHSSAKEVAAVFGFLQIYLPSGAASFLGQAWTIDVEVAFYLIVPLTGWVIGAATRRFAARRGGRDLSQRGRVALVVGLLAGATLASAYIRATRLGTLWAESPPATFYFFAPGIALAALELEFSGALARGRVPHLSRVLGISATALALVLAIGTSDQSNALLDARDIPSTLGVMLATGLAFAALLVRQCARGDSPRWVDNRVSRALGARSYPCYIIQSATVFEAIRIVGQVGGPWTELLALTAVGLPLTLAAGAIVHAVLERPVLAWGRGRSYRA